MLYKNKGNSFIIFYMKNYRTLQKQTESLLTFWFIFRLFAEFVTWYVCNYSTFKTEIFYQCIIFYIYIYIYESNIALQTHLSTCQISYYSTFQHYAYKGIKDQQIALSTHIHTPGADLSHNEAGPNDATEGSVSKPHLHTPTQSRKD